VYTTHGNGSIEAYLIEARSIAGVSGSPVFVNVPETLPIGFIPDPRFKGDPEDINWLRYDFLGLVHGHFDLATLNEDSVIDDSSEAKGINSGIGVVVPALKVMETLYQPELKAFRVQKAAEASSTSSTQASDKQTNH
jgi:hypothetical protein